MEREIDELALSIVLQISDLPPAEREEMRQILVSGDERLRAAVDEYLKAQAHAARNELWELPGAAMSGPVDGERKDGTGAYAKLGRSEPPRLDRFIPIDILGLGGQGEVWLMLDPRINRRVALKIVQPSQRDSSATLTAFRREAEIGGRLEHPNIVPVYDVTSEVTTSGEVNSSSPCFVMRLFGDRRFHDAIAAYHGRPRAEEQRGLLIALNAFEKRQSLESREELQRQFDQFTFDNSEQCDNTLREAITSILQNESDAGALSKAISRFHAASWSESALRRLLMRFQRACEGVAYAHSRGVIHRDLKPDNIMLGEYGETLVADWGLAKTIQPGMAEASTHDQLEANADSESSGKLKGTLRYMSPEQSQGRNHELTAATDIYSLGAILYRMLSGKDAIDGDSQSKVLRQIQAGDIRPLRAIQPRVPRALESIVCKAMARDPAARYSTALELSSDIENWLNDEPVSSWREPFAVRARRWMKRHQTFVIASLATLSVAIMSLILVAAIVADKNSALSQSNTNLKIASDTANRLRGEAVASADEAKTNERIAKEREIEVSQMLVKATVARGEEALTNQDYASARQASVESLRIAEDRKVVTPESRAFLRAQSSLLQYQAPGLRYAIFGNVPIRRAEYSPSAGLIALLQATHGTVRLANMATGRPGRVGFKLGPAAEAMSFSPDGKKLATSVTDEQERGIVSIWDVNDEQRPWKTIEVPGPVSAVVFSPDGLMLGIGYKVKGKGHTDGLGQIEIRKSDDLTLMGEVIPCPGSVTCIAFSPDSSTIAATILHDLSPLLLRNIAEQSNVVVELQMPDHEFCDLAFSPDGSLLGIASSTGAAVLLDGKTGKTRNILAHVEERLDAVIDEWGRRLGVVKFSPDGKSVITVCGDRTARLWNTSTGQPVGRTMTHGDHITDCSFNHDGTLIGTSCLDGTARLWNRNAGNAPVAILRHAGPITTIRIQSNDQILTASEDRTARIWSYQPPMPQQSPAGEVPVQSVVSKHGRWLAGRKSADSIQVWNTKDMAPVGPAIQCQHPVHLLSLAEGNSRLALAGYSDELSGRFSIVDFATGKLSIDSFEVTGLPLGMLFSPNGNWCAVHSSTAKEGKRLTVYEIDSKRSFSVSLVEPDQFVWHPQLEAALFVGCRDGSVHQITFPDNTPKLTSVDTGFQILRHLEIDSNGTLLAATTGESVQIWNMATWQPASQPLKHSDATNGAAFSADSDRLLTWGSDGVVKLWRRNSSGGDWSEVGAGRHERRVNDAKFSPDGRLIASVSDDGTAVVWESSFQMRCSLRHSRLPRMEPAEVQTIEFSKDSQTLFTSTSNSNQLRAQVPGKSLFANLKPDPRADETTIRPILARSVTQTWQWPLETTTKDADSLVEFTMFLNNRRLDSNGYWVSLSDDEQLHVLSVIAGGIPNSWAVRQEVARRARQKKDVAEAERQLALAVIEEQNDGSLWQEYASVLYVQDKYLQTVEAATKAEALGKTDDRIYTTRGNAQLYLDRYEDALLDLTRAAEKAGRLPFAWLDLANCQAMLGRFDEADASFAQAFKKHEERNLSIDFQDHYRRMILDLARHRQEDYHKRVRQLLEKNLTAFGLSAKFHIAMGAVLQADTVEDWSPIVQLAMQVAAEGPKTPTIQALPGYANYRAGDFVNAEKWLRSAIALEPPADATKESSSPMPHYFLALSLVAQKKTDGVQASINRGNELFEQLRAGPDTIPVYVRLPWYRKRIFEILKSEVETKTPMSVPNP